MQKIRSESADVKKKAGVLPRLARIGAVGAILAILISDFAFGQKPTISRPDSDKVQKARNLAEAGKVDDAVHILNDLVVGEKDKDKRALERFALAMVLDKADRFMDAESQLNLSLDDGLRIRDYVYLYLGLIQKKNGHWSEAQADFQKVISLKPPKPTLDEAHFQLGEVYLAEKNWSAAQSQLLPLRKAMKGDEKYPDVIYDLVLALKRGGAVSGATCRWARELYMKYPTLAQLHDWEPRLDHDSIDGSKVMCTASLKDFKSRLSHLWLGGEIDRADSELQLMRNAVGADAGYSLDAMLASQEIDGGHADEALKLLLKYYSAQRARPEYLLLLAKAASRTGEMTSAIAAYQSAFAIAPHGKHGADVLFQAAFTSYQIQDYDFATRQFGKLVKMFPGSKFARDAQWHLAWIRYLRGDYAGAYDSFGSFGKLLGRQRVVHRWRHHRRVVVAFAVDTNATDRVRYWMAMSLFRLGRVPEAVADFQTLARDPAIGYYALLAYDRLLSIPGALIPQGLDARLGFKKGGSGGAVPTDAELKDAVDDVEAARAEFERAQATVDDDSSEDSNDTTESATAENADSDDTDASTKIADKTKTNGDDELAFNEKSLATRFDRAQDLIYVGLELSARRELREIEKHVRTASDRQLLMSEYIVVRNYDRASFIGEVGFSRERMRDGLRGESKVYWQNAFPRAWESEVMKDAKQTTVPEELIWGIMRAESHFRQDARSPVGALGLMQLMPFTSRKVANLMNWQGFEVRSLLQPEDNIKVGSRYLQRLLEKFSGKIPLVAAAYNSGPHRVGAWLRGFGDLDMDEFIEHIPFIETRNYVKRVVRNYNIYGLLYRSVNAPKQWLVQPVGLTPKDALQITEVW